MSNTIAQTILAQLGGNKFTAMTGAKEFVHDENSLRFRLPSSFAKDGINIVRVTLADDLYIVEFFKMRGLKCDRVKMVEGVYADQLQNVFTAATGLNTSI